MALTLRARGAAEALVEHDELVDGDARACERRAVELQDLELVDDRRAAQAEMQVGHVLAAEVAVRLGEPQLRLDAGLTAEIGGDSLKVPSPLFMNRLRARLRLPLTCRRSRFASPSASWLLCFF